MTQKLMVLISNVLDRPGARQALKRSLQDGYAIALCEMLPPNEQVEASLSSYISLMMANPPLSNIVLSTESGDHAYCLSQSNGFPSLQRLQRQICSSRSADSSESWEKVDVRSFAKPAAGMVDFLEKELQPTHVLFVLDNSIDEETARNINVFPLANPDRVSTDEWLSGKYELTTQAVPPKQQQLRPDDEARRRFEYVDSSQNSAKFWEIAMNCDRVSFWTNHGKIGTNGRQSPIQKRFCSSNNAQLEYQKRIKEKLCKGYVEVH